MDRQIVDPHPGLNYNAAISSGELALRNRKKYIVAVKIAARLRIVKLDDTVFSLKNLVQF